MKIIHQDGFTVEERLSYRPIVYRNVVDSAQALVVAMKKLGLRCVDEGNQVLAEEVLQYRLPRAGPDGEEEGTEEHLLSPAIADAINQVWQDPVVKRILDEHSSEFYLMDSAS
jgi:guanine nucleotide-binding protein subunit alpha